MPTRRMRCALTTMLALLPVAPLLAGCESESAIADRQAQEAYNRIMQERWNAERQQEELEKLRNLARKEQGLLLILDQPNLFRTSQNTNDRPAPPPAPRD